jgi:hypothetical protein
VNSIRGEAVALDTNVFIFALRKEPNFPACETLLFDKLSALQVYMPLQACPPWVGTREQEGGKHANREDV